MSWCDAFFTAMRTSRRRRIGQREAEQLLTGDPTGSEHPELSQLLAAAAAPPRPDELAGLRAAVAAFERAGSEEQTSRYAPARNRSRRLIRPVILKVAAGVAVALLGGTAVAAETGNLPGGAQQRAHDLFSSLGVPPTEAPRRSLPAPVGTKTPPGGVKETAAPVPRDLCLAWRQAGRKPKGMAAEAVQALIQAAGGARHIAAYCAPLLGDDRPPVPSTTRGPGAAATPTPSHPGPAQDVPGMEKSPKGKRTK